MANAIIANLDNTVPLGLSKGKMGLCCFLFKAAEATGIETYNDVAETLFRTLFMEIIQNAQRLPMEELCEVGIGILMLLEEGLIDDSKDSDILRVIDRIVLSNNQRLNKSAEAFEKSASPIFLPKAYLDYRLERYSRNLDSTMAKETQNILASLPAKPYASLRQTDGSGIWNSIIAGDEKARADILEKYSSSVINETIQNGYYSLMTVNSILAAVGLLMMKNCIQNACTIH